MKKATTEAAAKTIELTDAKIVKIGEIEAPAMKKTSGIYLAFTVGSVAPDPLDWNELDSFSNKPPQTERKPRKKPYNKPEEVKRLEQVTGNKHRDDTANGLTRCIIAYIKYKGGQAERINTTGIPIDERRQVTDVLGHSRTIGNIEWRTGGGTNGSADISATIRGRSVKIEVKIGRDRQSEAQKAYQKQVETAGGIYYIAHDFTSFLAWYNQSFGKRGTK